MSSDVGLLLDKLRQLNAEVVQLVESISPEDWQRQHTGENWTLGITAHHIALGYGYGMGWIENASSGQPITTTPSGIDALNAEGVTLYASLGQGEVVTRLNQNLATLEKVVLGLSETDLNRNVLWVTFGREVNALYLMGTTIRHTTNHLESLKQALNS
jgi:uncharacterized damage-inducible protein DinB